jgi:hypothetical protein
MPSTREAPRWTPTESCSRIWSGTRERSCWSNSRRDWKASGAAAPQFAAYRGIKPSPDKLVYWPRRNAESLQRAREALKAVAARFSRVNVLETADLFIRDDHALIVDGDEILHQDDNHLTVAVARRIRHLLDMVLEQACEDAARDLRAPTADRSEATVPSDTPGDEWVRKSQDEIQQLSGAGMCLARRRDRRQPRRRCRRRPAWGAAATPQRPRRDRLSADQGVT